MIDIDDWVFQQAKFGPRVKAGWKPSAKDLRAGKAQSNSVRLVAKALAKAKQETHHWAWLSYIGMAHTWLAEGGDVKLAGHKTKTAPTRRREP